MNRRGAENAEKSLSRRPLRLCGKVILSASLRTLKEDPHGATELCV